MPANVQISFRGIDPSPSAEVQIRRKAAELQQFSDRASVCRVVLEAAHRHQRQGKMYHVTVDLAVPGGTIVVNREPCKDHAHEDVHVAIRDAFDAARRQLQDHMSKLEGQTKLHEAALVGRITQLFAERDYAFLATDDGSEVFFHRHSVAGGGFDGLKLGDRVRYVVDPEEGQQGPQASAVMPLGS